MGPSGVVLRPLSGPVAEGDNVSKKGRLMAEAKKHTRRLALLDAAGGVEPLGTGSPCADCAKPRTALKHGLLERRR